MALTVNISKFLELCCSHVNVRCKSLNEDTYYLFFVNKVRWNTQFLLFFLIQSYFSHALLGKSFFQNLKINCFLIESHTSCQNLTVWWLLSTDLSQHTKLLSCGFCGVRNQFLSGYKFVKILLKIISSAMKLHLIILSVFVSSGKIKYF